MTALLASGDDTARLGASSSRRFRSCFAAATATVVAAIPLAPAAAAGDHETVGGGAFAVYSDSPCTDFLADDMPFTACAGNWINTPPAKYIIVPLGSHFSVACETYAPNGLLFEHDVENLAEVPDKQRFWAAQGWGVYTPQAMCQLW